MQRTIGIVAAVIAVLTVLIVLAVWGWKLHNKHRRPNPRSNFCGAPPAPAALAEARGLMETGWRPDFRGGLPAAPPAMLKGDDVDDYAARKIHRDKSTFASIMGRSGGNPSNPAHVSARQARHNSMQGTFGGPGESDGWEDVQTAVDCIDNCMDGCGGTNCRDHCKDRCQGII